MTGKFIYVFDINTKENMVKAGFKLMKSDDRNDIYVFLSDDSLRFDFSNISTIRSDTITF